MKIKEIYDENDILDIITEYSRNKGGEIKEIAIIHDKECRGYGPMEHEVLVVKVVVEKVS